MKIPLVDLQWQHQAVAHEVRAGWEKVIGGGAGGGRGALTPPLSGHPPGTTGARGGRPSERASVTSPAGVFVHERALCESMDVGAGTRIWAFARVMAGARIGADCNVGDHAFVENGAVVGDRVTIKNQVALWDGLQIEDDVFIGPNAVFSNERRPRAAFKKDPRRYRRLHDAEGLAPENDR